MSEHEAAEAALQAALEQPVQEPVAWMRKLYSPEIGEFFDYKDGAFARETDSEGWTPLYTTPPRREPEQEAHIKDLEQARARDNIAFKQLRAQRDALLEAQNGKKVRNHEVGTRYQPPLEEVAITTLKTALRLADACDTLTNLGMLVPGLDTVECAAELRRMDEEITALRAALAAVRFQCEADSKAGEWTTPISRVLGAIEKAEGKL
jgi:hypothetical protein